jgi:O-antigen/teichoic acid export membrane protein
VGIIRKLASQTAIYGLSSMLGRFINFLLVIPHTEYLNSVGAYGDITTIFAFMAFLNVILTYGMETTFFKFIREGNDPEKVFSHAQKSLLISTLGFTLLSLLFAGSFAGLMGYPDNPEYVYCCLIFLVFDTLSVLPFARLRFEERPLKFASVKLINIFVNVALNLYLLIYTPEIFKSFDQVTLILIANSAASICSFAVLSPLAFKIFGKFDREFYNKMLNYAWPLIFVGLAGIVNETLDRTLLKHLLPSEEGSYQNGIYGAFYKLTMIMTMFVQAFRFAAEPFFFKQKESDGSKTVYAQVMYWFIAVCSFIFLACMFSIDFLAHLFIKNKAYFEDPGGFYIIPVLLMANLFLGIYYNLSIWYRLTNKTRTGALLAGAGALLTIVSNLLLIPEYGYIACAWITLIVYFLMCTASYILGHTHYPIPYHTGKYVLILMITIALWQISETVFSELASKTISIIIHTLLLGLLLLIIWLLQPKRKIV